MTTIVLSAGGTGGHLFPAQALAAELTRRGRKIIVMTDARGTQYPTYFPGAAIEIVPAAAFSDRSKLRLMTAPFEIMAGVVVAFRKLLRAKPAAVVEVVAKLGARLRDGFAVVEPGPVRVSRKPQS